MSLLIAEAVAEQAGGRLSHVVMVSGESWHDAVVGADVAGQVGGAVLLTPPDGEFGSILRAGSGNCGLRTDGTAECWRPSGLPPEPPAGRFAELHNGYFSNCHW